MRRFPVLHRLAAAARRCGRACRHRARHRAGTQDRGRRRRHVDRSALLQSLSQQQHRRAHLRQARADGSRLADDPRPRDVVEDHRRQDVGVQAAQGRQVSRRQRADRRRRGVLDRPRSAGAEQPRPVLRLHQGDRREERSSTRTRSASSTRRRIRWRPTTCRPSTSCRRRSPTDATTEDFNSGKAAIGSGRYKLVRTSTATASTSSATTTTGATSPRTKRSSSRSSRTSRRAWRRCSPGDVDAIEQPPTADLARLKSDPKFTLTSKISHRVIYFNFDNLERVEPVHHRPRTASRSTRTRCSTCASAARSPRRSTARRSPSA